MAAIMNNTGAITALEKSPVRADILRHNLALQWVTNTTIVRQEASSYLVGLTPESFDYILLDSPCSGMGRLSNDREEPWKYIDPANLQRRSDLQKHLLTRALPLLTVGGTLVYSTCTLGHEENADVIKAVLRLTPGYSIIVPDLSDIGATVLSGEQGTTILPDVNFEGFFVTKIVRKG
jgi:16S rRNA (cytosine967-C5)-methyltransferase